MVVFSSYPKLFDNVISLCDCYGTKRNVNFRLPKNVNVTTKFNINQNCRNSTKRVLAVVFLNLIIL